MFRRGVPLRLFWPNHSCFYNLCPQTSEACETFTSFGWDMMGLEAFEAQSFLSEMRYRTLPREAVWEKAVALGLARLSHTFYLVTDHLNHSHEQCVI